MTTKNRATDLPSFDPAQYLDSDAAVAQYLTAILEEDNPGLLAAALGDIARGRGISKTTTKFDSTAPIKV